MIPRRHVVAIAAACVLPRAIGLLAVRGDVLGDYTEKSDDFARVLVDSGTFGQIPGVPSAYTQPLYAWFLAPLYLIDRHWLVVGTAQILVALATALLVYLIGRRISTPPVALAAALVSTLHPYLVWHDIHVNREILDQLVGAGLVLATLWCAARPTLLRGGLLGLLTGLAVLGNTRLIGLPLVLGGWLLWDRGRAVLPALGALVAALLLAIVPWSARNASQVGCFTITTDTRALWKANNTETWETLRRGDWIDQVPDPAGAPPSPQVAADVYRATGRVIDVDECAQMRFYRDEVVDFWGEHPGEKAKLAGLAAVNLWSPRVGPANDRSDGAGTWVASARDWIVPLWFVPLVVLAVFGAGRLPRRFVALVLLLFAYETLAAVVFTGATRYRVAWEFLLALLAAPAVVDLARRARARMAR